MTAGKGGLIRGGVLKLPIVDSNTMSPKRTLYDFSTKCHYAKSIMCLDTAISGHEMLSTTYLKLSESTTSASDMAQVRHGQNRRDFRD